jgi:hypothetical protein
MGFITWIVNKRKEAPANNVQPQAENPKQMFTRQAAEEGRNVRPFDQMTPEQKAKVEAIKERLEKVISPSPDGDPPKSPGGGAAVPQAVRQNMSGQENAAPALSPTGTHKGQPGTETKPKAQPEKPAERPKTVPRPAPSWER